MAEHVSRPGSELCQGLQPLMPLAVTVWNDRSGQSRHWSEPRGEIIENGNDASLTGLRFSSRNFDKLLLPVKCTFCVRRCGA